MKQSITKSQWDELSVKNKDIFWLKADSSLNPVDKWYLDEYPNIGQIISFLGDEWYKIFLFNGSEKIEWNFDASDIDKFCDALWKVAKNKLI